MSSKYSSLVAALLLALTAPVTQAGTPLICFPFDIGTAKSLPAGKDWPGITRTYDRQTLVDDTLALLTPEMPVLVRMETLRRAAVYAHATRFDPVSTGGSAKDHTVAFALLEKLRERTKTATGPAFTLALFDLGYFTETLRHTGLDKSLDGYQILEKAAELSGHDPAMEFALALAASYPKRPERETHLARARAGAGNDTVLAANIASHLPDKS